MAKKAKKVRKNITAASRTSRPRTTTRSSRSPTSTARLSAGTRPARSALARRLQEHTLFAATRARRVGRAEGPQGRRERGRGVREGHRRAGLARVRRHGAGLHGHPRHRRRGPHADPAQRLPPPQAPPRLIRAQGVSPGYSYSSRPVPRTAELPGWFGGPGRLVKRRHGSHPAKSAEHRGFSHANPLARAGAPQQGHHRPEVQERRVRPLHRRALRAGLRHHHRQLAPAHSAVVP